MTLEKQIAKLARVIMEEIPGEPCQSESATECAIRIMRLYKQYLQGACLMKSDERLLAENRIDRISPKIKDQPINFEGSDGGDLPKRDPDGFF